MSGVLFLLPGTSVQDVAAAVRTELAAELARVDVPISSRPTAAEIAASVPPAVRAELAVELARLDVPVSTTHVKTYGGNVR